MTSGLGRSPISLTAALTTEKLAAVAKTVGEGDAGVLRGLDSGWESRRRRGGGGRKGRPQPKHA
jgi:hypothetical protein